LQLGGRRRSMLAGSWKKDFDYSFNLVLL